MDWIKLTLGVLSIVGSTGFIVTMASLRSMKRKQRAMAVGAEMDNEEKLRVHYEKMLEAANKRADEAYEKLQKVQGIADAERDKWVELSKEISEILLSREKEREELTIARFNICTVSGCALRKPPRHERVNILSTQRA